MKKPDETNLVVAVNAPTSKGVGTNLPFLRMGIGVLVTFASLRGPESMIANP